MSDQVQAALQKAAENLAVATEALAGFDEATPNADELYVAANDLGQKAVTYVQSLLQKLQVKIG